LPGCDGDERVGEGSGRGRREIEGRREDEEVGMLIRFRHMCWSLIRLSRGYQNSESKLNVCFVDTT